MEKEKIKFTYILDYLDFDDVLECLGKELDLKKGILRHYDLDQDTWIEKELEFEELKKEAFIANSEDGQPEILFEDVEIATIEESEIEINSTRKLELKDLDIVRIINHHKS